ncbi:RING finger protein 122 isoform X2 [Serinus canaria]|uniref:RING finger protein 122 isoform X2 n=1 Tax=Serinus canaria TaxID=9135 RepID=UPI0021CCEC80|nr:RING finger protein 122 isoform X2 [Serinus canaria]
MARRSSRGPAEPPDAPVPVVPRKLRQQAQSESFGYKEVVLKGDARRLNVHGVPAEVAAGSLRVPHVQRAPQAAPRRHRDPPGRAGVRQPRGRIASCGIHRDPPGSTGIHRDPPHLPAVPLRGSPGSRLGFSPRLPLGFVLVRVVLPAEFPAGS